MAREDYRRLLTEQRIATKQFLLEVDMPNNRIEAAKADPDIPIVLVGIIQTGDKPNRNLRMYPWSSLKQECLRYAEQDIASGTSYGELDHPEDSATPSVRDASHTIEDLWFKDKDVYAKIKLLNAYAPAGDPSLKARSVILNNKALGISSRALGSLTEGDEYDVVEEDLEIICWDLVANASNFGSEKMEISENREWRKSRNQQLLTESQCYGGNCNVKVTPEMRQGKLQELTEKEKTYINILGIEKFLHLERTGQLIK